MSLHGAALASWLAQCDVMQKQLPLQQSSAEALHEGNPWLHSAALQLPYSARLTNLKNHTLLSHSMLIVAQLAGPHDKLTALLPAVA